MELLIHQPELGISDENLRLWIYPEYETIQEHIY